MKQKSDCEVFQDRLDALRTGGPEEDARGRLEGHAEECPDCAVLLRLHDHLALPPQEELEADVPDELVSSLRSRLAAELAPRRAIKVPVGWKGRGRDWRTVAAVAAGVLLLAGIAALYAEVRNLQGRERALVEQLAEQQRRLAALEVGPSVTTIARTAGLASSSGWERMLARKRRVSVAELSDLLSRVPSNTTIYSRSEFEALMADAPVWLTTSWRARLAEIETEDGIQREELLRLMEDRAIDPQRSIPTARLLAFWKGEGRS